MQLKQTFSIQLPVDLYGELLKKVGKGKISSYIREMLEENLSHEKNCFFAFVSITETINKQACKYR